MKQAQLWDEMAQDYQDFCQQKGFFGNRIEQPAVLTLCGKVSGRRVLDFGCGQGRYAFLFLEQGALQVTGLDLSQEMIRLARRQQEGFKDSAVRFEVGAVPALAEYPEGAFDLIFSGTTLHFLEKLPPFANEASRLLAPAGQLVLSLIHPVYSALYPLCACPQSAPQLRYLDRKTRAYRQPWSLQKGKETMCVSYHHTFADYTQAFLNAGFILQSIAEPMPDLAWKEKNPKAYDDFLQAPRYLLLAFKKGQPDF